ncbi:MAG: hypothetical protein ABS46_13680 [Cytophagaceae bacterium SCN 52-12]|nr:MAG: hypothetical protein ABS46_13680 [Cytophagaceae bacterium SCN 52-12]
MSKHNFHTLLSRYRSGECTEREKHLVEQWFSMLDENISERSKEENEQLEEKLWKAIQERKELARVKPSRFTSGWKWAVAAVIIMTAAGWAVYLTLPGTEQAIGAETAMLPHSTSVSPMEKVSTGIGSKTVILPDGSEIRLSPYSSVAYSSSFDGDKREVLLAGKAFFKVVANPGKPFFVYSGEIVTRVLGTSFWIDGSNPARSIEVSVVTGKVTVSKRSEADFVPAGPVKGGVILTANQKVKFSGKSDLFELGLVEEPVPLLPEESEMPAEESFIFEDTPIAEVIEKLENAYGIEIILENDALKGCLFRGDITRQPLFNKLDLLCSAGNATYEIRGTRVLVSGEGCPAAGFHTGPQKEPVN